MLKAGGRGREKGNVRLGLEGKRRVTIEVGGRGRNRHHVRGFGEWGWGEVYGRCWGNRQGEGSC